MWGLSDHSWKYFVHDTLNKLNDFDFLFLQEVKIVGFMLVVASHSI